MDNECNTERMRDILLMGRMLKAEAQHIQNGGDPRKGWTLSPKWQLYPFPVVRCPFCEENCNSKSIYFLGTVEPVRQRVLQYRLRPRIALEQNCENAGTMRKLNHHPHVNYDGRICQGSTDTIAQALVSITPSDPYHPSFQSLHDISEANPHQVTPWYFWLLLELGHRCEELEWAEDDMEWNHRDNAEGSLTWDQAEADTDGFTMTAERGIQQYAADASELHRSHRLIQGQRTLVQSRNPTFPFRSLFAMQSELHRLSPSLASDSIDEPNFQDEINIAIARLQEARE